MKTIELTQGQVALVDDEDYEYLNQWNWHAQYSPSMNSYYAVRDSSRKSGKRASIRMNRVIMDVDSSFDVDHKNHNTLDNQKENLRICSKSQNMYNKNTYKNNSSGYKGVSLHGKKWRAKITVNKNTINLGSYDTKEEAVIMYDNAAREYHGEFAKTNN